MNNPFEFIHIAQVDFSSWIRHLVHIHHCLSNNMGVSPNDLLNADSRLVLFINRKDSGTNTLVATELACRKLGQELVNS